MGGGPPALDRSPCGCRAALSLEMTGFVRVANRRGWEVEVVGSGGVVETKTLASRDEALAYAESLEPDWIEIGDIVGLDSPGQQHAWTTLHRQENGSYAPSLLRWQAGTQGRKATRPDG
jgi:hypothetical protein